MELVLRHYQQEAVKAILEKLESGACLLVQLATGLGKTVIFSELVARVHNVGNVMIVAHREELVFQAMEHLRRVGIEAGLEMADSNDASGTYKQHVVVATIQTVSRSSRLGRINPERYALLIIDEAHHATARTYRKVIEHFLTGGVPVVGFTATPVRSDGRSLMTVFREVVFTYGIREAIHDGWLVPIRQFFLKDVVVDFSHIRTVAGDYVDADLERVIAEEKNLHVVADVASHAIRNGPVLVYTPGIRSAELCADIINRYMPGTALAVSGETDRHVRRGIIQNFRDGKLPVLVNCAIATEGFDAPLTRTIIVARPTKSRLLYTQILGRGTRPIPNIVDNYTTAKERRDAIARSPKPNLAIFDVIPKNEKTKLITSVDVVSTPDVWSLIPRRIEKIFKAAKTTELDNGIDPMEVIEVMRRERDIILEEQRSRVKIGRIDITANVRYGVKSADPFTALGVAREITADGLPPSDAQIAALRKLGINVDREFLTKSTASDLLDAAIRRRKMGMSSYKQIKLLTSRGVPAVVASMMTYKEAGVFIERLRRGNWLYWEGGRPPMSLPELEQFRKEHYGS